MTSQCVVKPRRSRLHYTEVLHTFGRGGFRRSPGVFDMFNMLAYPVKTLNAASQFLQLIVVAVPREANLASLPEALEPVDVNSSRLLHVFLSMLGYTQVDCLLHTFCVKMSNVLVSLRISDNAALINESADTQAS